MASLPRHHFDTTQSVGAHVLARLLRWLEACRPTGVLAVARHTEGLPERPQVPRAPRTSNARVLPFPIRGEALLVRMAERLRARVAGREWAHDPLLLIVSRRPYSRLTIDRSTYVEFDPRRAVYRVVMDADPDTRLTLETGDFDTAVSFIAPYVNDRLADATRLEAAS